MLSDSRFQFTNVVGDDGDNGGMTGNGQNDVDGGGMGALVPEGSPTVGVGTSIAKQQVNDGISDITYTLMVVGVFLLQRRRNIKNNILRSIWWWRRCW